MVKKKLPEHITRVTCSKKGCLKHENLEYAETQTQIEEKNCFHRYIIKQDATVREKAIYAYLRNSGICPQALFPLNQNAIVTPELITLSSFFKSATKSHNMKFYMKRVDKIMLQLIDKVARLHELGIVHRDIKPDNLGLTLNTRELQIFDFDAARFHFPSMPSSNDLKLLLKQETKGGRKDKVEIKAKGCPRTIDCGTHLFCSPEKLQWLVDPSSFDSKNLDFDEEKQDVWSIGWTWLTLLRKQYVWSEVGTDVAKCKDLLKRIKVRCFPLNDLCRQDIKGYMTENATRDRKWMKERPLLTMALTWDVKTRPTMKKLALLARSSRKEEKIEKLAQTCLKRRESLCLSKKKLYKTFVPKIKWSMQVDIKKRMYLILIDWLFSVTMEYNAEVETWMQACVMICRYLILKPNHSREKLQAIGCASLYLASEMIDYRPITLQELDNISANTYSIHEINQIQQDMIQSLEYDLWRPTLWNTFPWKSISSLPWCHVFFLCFGEMIMGSRKMEKHVVPLTKMTSFSWKEVLLQISCVKQAWNNGSCPDIQSIFPPMQ